MAALAAAKRSDRRALGLIPAKGQSVRVRRKNIRDLAGKPLLQWAIESARACSGLDRVVVSTEDESLAELARRCGAETPFVRPAHLSHDPYGVVDVCLHALDALEVAGDRFDDLVILLPTSPFRRARHIAAALEQYRASGAAFLMSVSELDHALLAAHLLKNGTMTPLHPEWINRLGARADKATLPKLVKANGAVTIVDVARFREERRYYVYPLAAYLMPWPDGLDVDTEEDLLFAEFLLQHGRVPTE